MTLLGCIRYIETSISPPLYRMEFRSLCVSLYRRDMDWWNGFILPADSFAPAASAEFNRPRQIAFPRPINSIAPTWPPFGLMLPRRLAKCLSLKYVPSLRYLFARFFARVYLSVLEKEVFWNATLIWIETDGLKKSTHHSNNQVPSNKNKAFRNVCSLTHTCVCHSITVWVRY